VPTRIKSQLPTDLPQNVRRVLTDFVAATRKAFGKDLRALG
jgi:hypothetical protein